MDQERLNMVTNGLIQATDLLYQENITYAYQMLVVILPQLEMVISEIEEDEVRNELRERLEDALQAMEEEDYILLADVFQYEINQRLLEFVSDRKDE